MVANDFYAILGVKSTATDDEIKKGYRKKALQYHPDKNSSSTAEDIFKQINKAYETLSDVDKRRTYDLQQQQPTKSSSSSSQQRKHEPSFGQTHFSSTNNNSSRFHFHDPFFNIHQRHAYFTRKFQAPNFSFFDKTFASSDDDDDTEKDYEHFDSFRPSQRPLRAKWNQNWPFENNSFMMFEMLTRSLFDQFLNDDFLWHPPSARLRSASQQQRGSSMNRTKIPVNHVTPTSKYRSEYRRPSSSSRFSSKDSDEENVEEHFVFQQAKPTTTNDQRFRRRTTDNQKLETCQYCFYPLTSRDNLLKHEATCRHRPDQEKLYTTKCSYCFQNIRLGDYLDHEELCRQFGTKRQSTENKHHYNPMSKSFNDNNPLPSKSSFGGLSNDINQLRTCNRCHRIFPVLSDLFNHDCDDEKDLLSSSSSTNNNTSSTSPSHIRKLTSPLSPPSSPISIRLSPTTAKTEHIPVFKRPLFQPDDKQQYSSNAYFTLRNPSSPIRVNS